MLNIRTVLETQFKDIIEKKAISQHDRNNNTLIEAVVDRVLEILDKKPLMDDVRAIILLMKVRPQMNEEELAEYFGRLIREYDVLIVQYQLNKTLRP